MTWLLLETSIFWPSVSFHSLIFFYWKNLLSAFHTILMKLETIIKKKNKKKQLENPFRKSSNSQLWTKYWSRLTFLINISLHSSKAWGRLTLIETTSIIRIVLFFADLFSLAQGFLWVSISRIRDRWQLFPTKQSEIRLIKMSYRM